MYNHACHPAKSLSLTPSGMQMLCGPSIQQTMPSQLLMNSDTFPVNIFFVTGGLRGPDCKAR